MLSAEGARLRETYFGRLPVSGWHPDLTLLIAWRNLVHDRVRLAVTLIGIAFSTILMGLQLGMLLNFMHTTSTIVDHAGADLWVAAHGVRTVDLATPLEKRRRFQSLDVNGVSIAEPYLLQFAFWKKADGIRETVIIVGVDPHAEMGLPWAMLPDRSIHDALSTPDGVIIDRLYADKARRRWPRPACRDQRSSSPRHRLHRRYSNVYAIALRFYVAAKREVAFQPSR